MLGPIRRMFTRTVVVNRGRKYAKKTIKRQLAPNETLVYGVALSLVFFGGLVGLQLVHLVVMKEWNENIWASITGMTGLIVGFFFAGRA